MQPARSVPARLYDAIAILGIILLTVERWVTIGAFPPGLDGAQWLSIGRGYRGIGRSTQGIYPPLIPAVATVGETLLGPLPTIRLLAVGSGLLLCLAIWLIARDALGPGWALLIALVVLPASALAEPVMYGGYPQQTALALGLTALWAACRYLANGNKRTLLVVALSSGFTALAHHIYYPLLLSSIFAAAVIWFWTRPGQEWRANLVLLYLALLPSIVTYTAIARALLDAVYSAPLRATTRSIVETWRYATREAPGLWLFVVSCGLISLVWSRHLARSPTWLLAASLIGPSALLLVATGQPRLAPPVLIGSVIAVGIGARQASMSFDSFRPAIVAASIAVAVLVGISAHRAAVGYAGYYRVVEPSIVAAVAAIERDGHEGTIAVRADRRGWPIGWWFEALQETPVLVGADERWLAFPDERERSSQARALFDGDLSGAEFQTLAARASVRYLVIPKWEWIGWERWTADSRFPVTTVFDDDRYLVLRVKNGPPPR